MTDVVTLTNTATEQITSEMEADGDHLLRFRVAGGGCSGLSYELFWEMTEFVKETDTIIDYPSFKVVVDQKSLIYFLLLCSSHQIFVFVLMHQIGRNY